MSAILDAIGEEIILRMMYGGTSQADIAREIGVDAGDLSRWLSQRKPVPRGRGAKRKWNPSIVVPMVCNIIATSDKGLAEICADRKYFPHAQQITKWLIASPELDSQYARAKERQADFMADQIRQLADECRLGVVTTTKTAADGTVTIEERTSDMVERSRLQLDARKWLASKLAPKKYGDKMQVQQSITVETVEQQIARLTGGCAAIDITPECLRIE